MSKDLAAHEGKCGRRERQGSPRPLRLVSLKNDQRRVDVGQRAGRPEWQVSLRGEKKRRKWPALEVGLITQLTTLVSFNSANGQGPEAGLIADANGDLFGTTYVGGANGDGTVFEIVNTGTLAAPVYASVPTTLVSFNSSDEANPCGVDHRCQRRPVRHNQSGRRGLIQ